ncbi:MAG TPA: cupredoxin domain-containing protein [Mycobacteriales bacterium]|nr:cupredoxin domain-containing protein [Mycobacteriales bacterium]
MMDSRPLYRSVAAVGLAAHALSSLIHIAVVQGEDRIFFGVLLAVAAAAAAVAWSWGKGLWVSLVASLLLEVATFWFVFPLFQGFTLSALDAVPALIGFVGVWTAIVASILGLARRKSERMFTDSTQRKLLIGTGLIVVLAVASTALTFANKKTVSTAEAAGTVEVVMHDGDQFTPANLKGTAGQEMRLLLKNDDPFAHTFDLPENQGDISEVVGPGSETVVSFTPKTAGKIEYVCEFHGDMKGTMEIA